MKVLIFLWGQMINLDLLVDHVPEPLPFPGSAQHGPLVGSAHGPLMGRPLAWVAWLRANSVRQRVLIAAHVKFSGNCAHAWPVDGQLNSTLNAASSGGGGRPPELNVELN